VLLVGETLFLGALILGALLFASAR